MSAETTFDDALEVVERLPIDQQLELVKLLRRRLAEYGRRQVVQELQEGRTEFATGKAKPATVDDLMREIEP